MFPHRRFKSALLQSSCWTGAVPFLGSTLAIGLMVSAAPAHATNECGVPSGSPLVVVCDTANSPYEDAIQYTTGTDFHLHVESGVQIIRPDNHDDGANNDGIQLDGNGSGLIRVTLDPGVDIVASGGTGHGVQVHAVDPSSHDIEIDSAANITFTHTGNAPGASAGGLIGWNDAMASTGYISITHRAGSLISVEADAAAGIYALQYGMGAVSMVVGGDVNVRGEQSFGVNIYAPEMSGTGDLTVVQSAGSTITTVGNSAVGIYVLNYGERASYLEVGGTIDTDGINADGIGNINYNTDSTAGAVLNLTETSRITTRGDASYGVWVHMIGTGEIASTIGGRIETFQMGSSGIYTNNSNLATTERNQVDLVGTGGVVTHGDRANAVHVYQRSGQAVVTMSDASFIRTGGRESHGIRMETDLAPVLVTQGAGTVISVSGEESSGIYSTSMEAATIDIGGWVEATGRSGTGINVLTVSDTATVSVASGAVVLGGWLEAPLLGDPAAGVLITSPGQGLVENAGWIGAQSDLAVISREAGLEIRNTGVIMGFVEYASGAGNSFANQAGGYFELRHFADTDGDGTPDTKRVAISTFGGADSVFDNAGTLHLAPVETETTVDATGYYVPTTGVDKRPLDTSFYDINRPGVVQAQLVGLGTFNHSGVIDLRGGAIGNTLVITGNSVADGTSGGGVFVANGGRLYVNAVLNEGLAPGGAVNSHADMLVVDSTRLGTAATAIHVSYALDALGGNTEGNGIQLVEVLDKAASEAGVFVLGNTVAAGAYEYALHHHGVGDDATDGNWYLRSTIADSGPSDPGGGGGAPGGDPSDPSDPSDPGSPGGDPSEPSDPGSPGAPGDDPSDPSDPGDPATDPADGEAPGTDPGAPSAPGGGGSDPADETRPEYPNYRRDIPTYVALPALAHRFGMEMLGNYHDRVGQDYIHLPETNAVLAETGREPDNRRREASMWGRAFGFRGEFGNNHGSVAEQYGKFRKRGASYNRHSHGLQMGLDLHRVTGPQGSRLVAGVYAGAGEITGTVDAVYGGRSGKARLTGYSLGGYWTHTGSKGSYIDFVLQGTRYKSKVETASADGFSPDGWGVSASIEGGRPFMLGNGWVLEPQAQLIHQYLTFEDGQDLVSRIHYDVSHSTYGRLGARLVRNWTVSGERRMTAWGRFNVWHDFEQSATTRISNLSGLYPVDLKASLGGTWGQAQLAVSGELTSRVSAFVSGDYNFSLDQANAEGFGWRVGMRVRF